MQPAQRMDRIVTLVEHRGYVSVAELSALLRVSEVTIRRDLKRLDAARRLRRTTGGAAAPALAQPASVDRTWQVPADPFHQASIERADVLIVSSSEPFPDGVLLEQARQRSIPVVAEAVRVPGARTVVTVNNYQAGYDLGEWAGQHACDHFGGSAYVLDLTYDMPNTQQRSQGFVEGLRAVLPDAVVCLSADAQAHVRTAYQLTTDALSVYPQINMIFAINDTTAQGALEACADRGVDPARMLILPFGLEGDTLKAALMAGGYCQAGLAMFPEIVGPVCLEAALRIYQGAALPDTIETPHAVLTRRTLPDFYAPSAGGWRLREDAFHDRPGGWLADTSAPAPDAALPHRIGFVVPFAEHEWYQNLIAAMRAHARAYPVALEVVSSTQTLHEELTLRRRAIARVAAREVQPGDVIILDHGEATAYLAQALREASDITVITNSLTIFELLRGRPAINLILTGGQLAPTGELLLGPTANSALRELCATKLFLAVDGVSLSFGLSHGNLDEVPVKQAMLQSAQETILLADHTKFKHTAVAHVAPITAAAKLITDNALPASTRLDLVKLGVQVLLAAS